MAMFQFTEYFVRQSIFTGISLLLISTFLFFFDSGEQIHDVAISLFLAAALLWISFGVKFKKQLYHIDEPLGDEAEENKYRIFKITDLFMSSVLVMLISLTLAKPLGFSIYVLLGVLGLLFFTRIYQIVIISDYLKKANRN
ncbi:MAG: hypothetical protein ACKOX3_00600 [Bacteroidota bacterium]